MPVGQVGKYYPAEDVQPKKGPTPVRNAPRLRKSITPGSVVILVAGRFKGKKVVCLKQLTSGLLLINGPYATNGVPLRRVNQRYVIATSTKVSVDGVDVSKIDDSFFAREKKSVKSSEETLNDTASGSSRGTTVSQLRKDTQTKVDNALLANIKKVELLESYLKAKFTLKNGDKPHLMKF